MTTQQVDAELRRLRARLNDNNISVPVAIEEMLNTSQTPTQKSKHGIIRRLSDGNNKVTKQRINLPETIRSQLEDLFAQTNLQPGWTDHTLLKRLESENSTNSRIGFQQRHLELPVFDSTFNALLDQRGALIGVTGTPFSTDALPTSKAPDIGAARARTLAIAILATDKTNGFINQDSIAQIAPELGFLGSPGRLVWKVQVHGRTIEHEVIVDALNGRVLRQDDLIGYAEPLQVRRLVHPGGRKAGSTSTVVPINVNPEALIGNDCLVRLQRLGSGRARMWNARLSGGTNTQPIFNATMALGDCTDLSGITLFEQSSSATADESFRFNEQSAYIRAQQLKTQLDRWGRSFGSSYGYYYPVNAGRDVNVEIVVNGDSERENDWCNFGVMHGCFRSSPPDDWFPGVEDPKAVFLFNSAGNAGSPQFVGSEFTSSYSIIAHEVGHFVSWSYGSWLGRTSNEGRSLNEGMSMALPAVWGKSRWPSSLDYSDSFEVTTGSRIGGNQWSHHAAGSGSIHSDMDCISTNPYQLAWPWVEAIWELANNTNADNGSSIWLNDNAAILNTGDFLMNLLYTQAGVSNRDWTTIANQMVLHQLLRHIEGFEQGALAGFDSVFEVIEVLDHHGLFDDCL